MNEIDDMPIPTLLLANDIQRWFLVTLYATFALFGFAVNGFTIGMIRAHARFHKPEYTVLSLCAMVNIVIHIAFAMLQVLPRLLLNENIGEGYPFLACRIFSVVGITFGLISVCSTSVLSITRYLQFCQPLFYLAHVTDNVVYAAFGFVFTICATYTVLSEVLIGRRYTFYSFTCTLPQTQATIFIQTVLFIVIPLSVIIWCVRRIQRVILKKHDSRVASIRKSIIRHDNKTNNIPMIGSDKVFAIATNIPTSEATTLKQNVAINEKKNRTTGMDIKLDSRFAKITGSTSKAAINTKPNDITGRKALQLNDWMGETSGHLQVSSLRPSCSYRGNQLTIPKTQQEGFEGRMQHGSSTSIASKGKRSYGRRVATLKRNRSHKGYTQKSAATKTLKLIVFLSGTFLLLNLIPSIGRMVMAVFRNYLDGRNIGELSVYIFVKRYIGMIYHLPFPTIHPIILIWFDKNYLFFKKYALCRHNRVDVV